MESFKILSNDTDIDLSKIKFSGSNNDNEIKNIISESSKKIKDRPIKPHKFEFMLISNSEIKFNESIANAIRRSALSEHGLVKRLYIKSLTTNDPYINALKSDIERWFEMMPILQSIDNSFTTTLNYNNNTTEIQTLRTYMIDNIEKYVVDTPIIDILPGKSIKIEFVINREHSFLDGKYRLTHEAISLPLVKNANNEYVLPNFSEYRSTTASFQNFKIIIGTNGEVKPDKFMKDLFENIRHRLLYVKSIINKFDFKDQQVGKNNIVTIGILAINNESRTITQMIVKKVYELMPDIQFIQDWCPDDTVRNVEIKVKFTNTRDDIIRVFTHAIDQLAALYANL